MNPKRILFIAALCLHVAAFSQTNPLVKYLPDDVSMLVKFDLAKLITKIPMESFRQSPIYKELMKEPDNPLHAIIADPLKSGVDFGAGIILAMKTDNIIEHGSPTVYIFGKLLDAGRFTSSIQSMVKDKNEKDNSITRYGTDQILFAGGITAGWNNDIFVMTTGYASEIRDEISRTYDIDSTTIISTSDTIIADTPEREPVDIDKLMEKIKKSQRDLCFELLTPKQQNSFSGNELFSALMSSPGDIKIWNTTSGNPLSRGIFPMHELLSELQEFMASTKTAIINFEQGKIVVQAFNYPRGEMLELYQKYPPAQPGMEFIQRLPNGKILGLLNISYNSEMAKELLQKKAFGALMDTIQVHTNIDPQLVQGALKNRMTLAVIQTDETNSKEGIQMIAAVPIADKTKFGDLSNRVKHLIESKKTKEASDTVVGGETRVEYFKGINPVVKSNDEMVVFSLTPGTAEAFLKDLGMQPVPEWMEPYRNYPIFIHVDLRALVRMGFSKDAPERLGMNERVLYDLFDKIIYYGGEFEKGRVSSTLEFRFSKADENSLKQLFDLVGTMMTEKSSKVLDDEGTDDIERIMDSVGLKIDTIRDDGNKHNLPGKVPTFSDPEVQEFANEYAEFIAAYKNSQADPAKLSELTKKMETWGKKSQSLGAKLSNNPEDAQKWADWVAGLYKDLSPTTVDLTMVEGAKEEELPPPSPPSKLHKSKVETKKVRAPVKKD